MASHTGALWRVASRRCPLSAIECTHTHASHTRGCTSRHMHACTHAIPARAHMHTRIAMRTLPIALARKGPPAPLCAKAMHAFTHAHIHACPTHRPGASRWRSARRVRRAQAATAPRTQHGGNAGARTGAGGPGVVARQRLRARRAGLRRTHALAAPAGPSPLVAPSAAAHAHGACGTCRVQRQADSQSLGYRTCPSAASAAAVHVTTIAGEKCAQRGPAANARSQLGETDGGEGRACWAGVRL